MTGDSEGPISLNYPIRSNRLQDLGNSCAAEWNVRWRPASYYMLGSRVLRPLPLLHAQLNIFSRVYVNCDVQSKSYVASQSAPAISSRAELYFVLMRELFQSSDETVNSWLPGSLKLSSWGQYEPLVFQSAMCYLSVHKVQLVCYLSKNGCRCFWAG